MRGFMTETTEAVVARVVGAQNGQLARKLLLLTPNVLALVAFTVENNYGVGFSTTVNNLYTL